MNDSNPHDVTQDYAGNPIPKDEGPPAKQLEALWESSDSPPDVFEFLQQHNGAAGDDVLCVLLADQNHRWKTEAPHRVEDYLGRLPALSSDPDVKLQLAVGEFKARQAADTEPNIDEFTSRFSDISDQLRSKLSELVSAGNDQEDRFTTTQTFISDQTVGDRQLGRYRLERVLGEGAFGRVYLAYDGELQRQVAIKVPTAERFQKPEDAEQYLAEARTVASLNHPNIVPVHDVGRTDDGSIYVVSKFIEGCTLGDRIKQDRPSHDESAKLMATVAQALQHAHDRRLIHRDIKPANVLLEGADATPYVADFGLAIREEDYLKDRKLAGTPAYMSPEQARGEGHRLDGRSDIFSLGVVLYELLTGKKPFRGSTPNELLHQVVSVDPRPPRELDESIPAELERICLKALSKRASDRYATGIELADDLLHWSQSPQQEAKELQIVPKGLRSFDAEDADFFLDLLSGPRNRNGLPESIQFWKTRIEETDPDKTFSVGLIYGPSGCGKSSLVKAGLLPRLSKDVTAIYVEATPDETETRILRGLRKSLPELPQDLGLVETFSLQRRAERKKVVIVLDQFEQWLHAHRAEQETELVAALRQCDGGNLQAVVMVRDDFAMAAARFMDMLDIPILQGHNFATVDLFDVDHAEKVLVKFGQAFGKLPAQTGKLSDDEQSFVQSVASGLAQDGKIVSVRLALFAEMVKGKPWVPATLEEVGGTEGIGVSFLEETFAARTANPKHRQHQVAAREVLKALLPEVGSDIKGHMRSHSELLVASGYQSRPGDFNELLRILDGELRLITPTDPEGFQTESGSDPGSNFYQLTHDYLVPSLRDWLTRKQQETRKGRAELKLAERSALWNAKQENRHLLSLLEWASITTLTEKQKWTDPQRKMMGKAGRVHGFRSVLVLVALVAVVLGGISVRSAIVEQRLRTQAELQEKENSTRAEGLVSSLLSADIAGVPAIVSDLKPYREWADPLLREENDKAAVKSRQKLHASLALLPVDATQVDYLYGRLLDAEPHEVPVIRDALAPHKDALLDKLWAVVEKPDKGKEPQRLRVAAALAKYDPESEKWAKVQETVGNDLVAVPAMYLAMWMDSLRPVRMKLFTQLFAVCRDATRREVERSLATDILADYAADQPPVLADLLMDADDRQFAVIYPKFKEQGEQGLPVLTGEIDKKLPKELPSSDEQREKLAKRQANAAVALLRMNQPAKVWPLLKHSPDPRVRSYLIHRLSPLGADAQAIVKRLNEEPDITIRRALLLSLGEFKETEFTPDDRKAVLPKLQEMYQTASDPGLHGAAEWLLRQWQQEAWLTQVNDEWAKDKEGREKKIAGIKESVTKDKETPPQWYVNGQGQTYVVIPGPVEFMMGSPTTEAGRRDYEVQHKRRIGRTFAIAAKAVTMEQYRQFEKGYSLPAEYSRLPHLPVVNTDWYRGAKYCNWLSEQEGLPAEQWCYEIKENEFKLKGNYLSLDGYRLPTEAELEYATRAGALTSRYFGETDELLPKYAWYNKNSQEKTWPVGSLKPSDLGLFDVQGNVFTWCQESFKGYPQGAEAAEDKEDSPKIAVGRVVRGGSFDYLSSLVRSAARFVNQPTYRVYNLGFRPARTLPPVPLTSLPPTP